MRKRNPYKHHKKGAGRFVQLHDWFMRSEAWATLKPGPRALYVELKRRYNGANNGQLVLSHRDAAKALGVNRNTVGPWFAKLQERGFIRMMQGPYLGPSGIGKASIWALEEERLNDQKPGKAFMSWREKQNPRQKNGTPRHEKQDGDKVLMPPSAESVPKIGTG